MSPAHKWIWSKPYFGIQHLRPTNDNGKGWATVTAWENFAELSCWFPGCGFSPTQSTHESPEAARAAGETFVRGFYQ